ncbi:sensor histidine kinase [Aliikangiella sp. G2MR2-5]|uniref:sensor histidine kinase n=1 Tax=Aliikangiella sp. G2MR2-5 TaxID=2788943 RepID=UPI0018A95C6B|nr:histidine kinase [Aliikangiella sp. G2MR2-5]
MKPDSFYLRALFANFAIWTAFISISILASILDSSRAGREVNIALRIASYFTSFGPWMLITPVFFWLVERAKKNDQSLLVISLCFVVIWLPIAMAFDTLSSIVGRPQSEKSFIQQYLELPAWYWTYQLLLFGVVFGSCVSIIFYRRSQTNKLEAISAKQDNIQLELQLKELQMKSLQTQLEPHFLFNALNSIAGLIRIEESGNALKAIRQLSDLLRYAVSASDHLFVTLDDELSFVRDYVALQRLRFEDKLQVTIKDERKNQNHECPPFLLQIFVENAIRHGLEESGKTMELTIKISDRHKQLNLFIQNTHDKISKNKGTLGIGLKNLKDRLNILYQSPVVMNILESTQHYTVELTIPIEGKDNK